MRATPRYEALKRRGADISEVCDFAQQIEVELADCRAMLKSWYEAASPYATAEALKEALAQRPEERTITDEEIYAIARIAEPGLPEGQPAGINREAPLWKAIHEAIKYGRTTMNVSRSSEEK